MTINFATGLWFEIDVITNTLHCATVVYEEANVVPKWHLHSQAQPTNVFILLHAILQPLWI